MKKILISIFIIHPPWSESIHILHRINNVSFILFFRGLLLPPTRHRTTKQKKIFIKNADELINFKSTPRESRCAEEGKLINIFYDTPRSSEKRKWNELRVKNWKLVNRCCEDGKISTRFYIDGTPCWSSINGTTRSNIIMNGCNPSVIRWRFHTASTTAATTRF